MTARHPLAWMTLFVLAAACGPVPRNLDPTVAVEPGELGQSVLSLLWSFELDDRSTDTLPQEFARPVIALGLSPAEDQLFVGNKGGWFYALDPSGKVIWKKQIGAVSSQPALVGGRLYIGTDDGYLVCLSVDGEEKWKYATQGPILETPVVSGDTVLFANEDDHVYALDRAEGTFRWQYNVETPDEFTLRGHSGVALSDDLAFAGFSNGTLVALRTQTGSVAWLASLASGEDRFVDVDVTPLAMDTTVFAVSSAGGLFALDRATGLVKWQLPVTGGGGLTADDERLFLAAADEGVYATDHRGNVLWRQGTKGGGEPATPIRSGSYLFYSLSSAGLLVADHRSGVVHEFFDPGYGISSAPVQSRDRLYVVSNSAVLYAFSVY